MEIKKILVPTDFSEGSKVALDSAIGFAKQFNSEIHILHVITPIAYPTGFEITYSTAELDKELLESSKKKLEEIEANFKLQNLNVITVIEYGSASEQTLDYANDNNIDLIFIATHGANGFEHFVFGSTTEKILRKANCPVYVLRMKN